MRPRFVPEEAIPSGDETDRLHRWGYKNYRDLFNARLSYLNVPNNMKIS
ncbi:MAG: hypothetical protein Q7W38_01475 [Deltaproteobacteria bacterium]|nr:hypothetical protein [Deltaproteobacteria bacterium]